MPSPLPPPIPDYQDELPEMVTLTLGGRQVEIRPLTDAQARAILEGTEQGEDMLTRSLKGYSPGPTSTQ